MTTNPLRHPGPVPGSTLPRTRRTLFRRMGGCITMIGCLLLLVAPVPSPAQTGMPDLRAADVRLNAQYRATMAEMRRRDASPQPDATTGPSYAQALLDAQRKWIAFRDANCLSVAYEYRGGSAERLSRGTCLVSMTDARARELRRIQRGASPD